MVHLSRSLYFNFDIFSISKKTMIVSMVNVCVCVCVCTDMCVRVCTYLYLCCHVVRPENVECLHSAWFPWDNTRPLTDLCFFVLFGFLLDSLASTPQPFSCLCTHPCPSLSEDHRHISSPGFLLGSGNGGHHTLRMLLSTELSPQTCILENLTSPRRSVVQFMLPLFCNRGRWHSIWPILIFPGHII